MLIVSSRASCIMPDGLTVRPFDVNESSVAIYYPEEIPTRSMLFFAGYNNPLKGWHDSAIDAVYSMATHMRERGITYRPVAALWAGRGENVVEKIQFHVARKSAVLAAQVYYAPLVTQLLRQGKDIVLVGHSCGCYLIQRILERIPEGGKKLRAVIWMEAAMRQAETTLEVIERSTEQLINFHSREDSALKFMQRDFVDEAGGWWGGLKALFSGRNERREPIVGMHGIPYSSRVILNVDHTAIIGARHSDGRHYPGTWELIARELAF